MAASERTVHAQLRSLGPLLCWAIVYADIGTSIYYVPGILSRDVGTSAATFVLATSLAFVLLAEKYAEIAARYPSGGGVVSVAEEAFGPRIGALGGMLILVDYFLTAAISVGLGLHLPRDAAPRRSQGIELRARGGRARAPRRAELDRHPRVGAGERRDRRRGLRRAAAPDRRHRVADRRRRTGSKVRTPRRRPGASRSRDAITGYAAAWLAFSGLESLAQISPAMAPAAPPHRRVAMRLVVIAILATSPLLTAFATNLLTSRHGEPGRAPVRARASRWAGPAARAASW